MQNDFHQKQYDAETQEIARVAKSIQGYDPEISWGECIRLAEKYHREGKV